MTLAEEQQTIQRFCFEELHAHGLCGEVSRQQFGGVWQDRWRIKVYAESVLRFEVADPCPLKLHKMLCEWRNRVWGAA